MIYLESFLIIILVFHIAFLVGQLLRNNGIADVAWGLSFVIIAWLSLLDAQVVSVSQFVVVALVTIWGLRLCRHVLRRANLSEEDWRYARWRRQWGEHAAFRAYLQVYLLQAIILFIIALPIIYVNSSDVSSLGFYFMSAGILVWLFGFYFESVGDKQLLDFKKKPHNKDKLMTTGLWAYTRHPNYFGEASMWWGIWIIALGSWPYPWWTIVSPLLITFLLLKVSGVPMLEKKLAKHPDWQDYAAHTSPFLPRKPGKH